MIKRKKILIDKKFQFKIISGVVLLIISSILLAGILSYFIAVLLEKNTGILYYGTSQGQISDLIAVSSLFIIKPVLIKSIFAGCCISILFAAILVLFYSHRLAGPVYRIQKHLDLMITKNYDIPIKLRKNDEFKGIAEKINLLQSSLKEKE